MYLLKKVNQNDNFIFNKILASGYDIDEQPDTITKTKFINGKRKRVYTTYEDVRIRIDLGGLNANDTYNYIQNLVDGEYQYWSFKYNMYKNANFIVILPNLVADKVFDANNYYLEDFTVLIEKSSDVEEVSL